MSEQATAAAAELVRLIDDKPFDYPRSSDVPEIAAIIDAAFAPVVAERDALKAALAEYCDDDEASSGFGSGCKGKAEIREIRERHGLK